MNNIESVSQFFTTLLPGAKHGTTDPRLNAELAKPLTGLLFDMVCHLCDFIKEPCFVLT
ncbi:hypothetical protein ACP26F_04425 [Franconibacter pulveris 1160]